MPKTISPTELKGLIEDQSTFALLDVREHGEYNNAHVPGSSSLPRRLLEFRMPWLVPYKGTSVIICDDDGRRARLAAATLEGMGYTSVSVLEGGINGWATSGYPLEWGTNVHSKDFGEKVQVQRKVPEIGPEELCSLLQGDEEVIILDARTPEEHHRSCIPGSRSVPGGELALRISDIVQNPDIPIVVHCARRTRSIIGTSTLQRMGLSKVYGLRNGTMGWQMAGLELERGSQRLELRQPSPEGLADAETFATRVAQDDGIQYLTVTRLEELMARADEENVYLIDVRTEEEFIQGHVPGFRWCPGGQAVQQADDVVAVKNAQIVFSCDGRVRSSVTASWYRQMGFPNVHVVDGGTSVWTAGGFPLERGMPDNAPFGYEQARGKVDLLSAQELNAALEDSQDIAVVFVGTSREFSNGHVPGARWVPRGWLEFRIDSTVPSMQSPVVVTCSDGFSSVLAGATLRKLGYEGVSVLEGGMKAWREAKLPVELGLSGVMSPPDDMVDMGVDRSWAGMINYLRWEEDLGKKYEPTSE